MDGQRLLIVMADDYGIGPPTSQGILDLAARGIVKAAVVLVNSPFVEAAIDAWKRAGVPLELGWHPCLTLDRPLSPLKKVASLVRADGSFYPLGSFLSRLFLGRFRLNEIEIELQAQYSRFRELVGHPPTFVNGQHHMHVFPGIATVLSRLLQRQKPPPYVRRMREPWQTWLQVPGARVKRLFLSTLSRRAGRLFDCAGFPGNDYLAGVTSPAWVSDTRFFSRWLARVPGRVVELACHPGYRDETLIGRDCTAHDGKLQRRVDEMHLLSQPDFLEACRRAGFILVSPSWSVDHRLSTTRRAG